MLIYKDDNTGLRMRVTGCKTCPNRGWEKHGRQREDVCLAMPIMFGGGPTSFHEPIDRQTLLHGWLIRCPLKLAFPKEEDE